MNKKLLRVLFVSAMMVLTSLAGCIGTSDDTSDEPEPGTEYYGKIMTSTYHVEQLVSAIVGDTATVEMMSTTNTPVHDYTPSIIDLERLKGSDAFFYHGLDLEPWVTDTLASEGVPPSFMTHTMPTGEITLDYRTILVNDLCEQLNTGEKQANNLMSYEDQAGQLEIHLEKDVQTLTFPPADTSHEGHDHDDHDEDGHDDHDEDGHDDHDDHAGHEDHAHAEAEMVIQNPVNCPANTVISVFHLEEGEHIVEFETNWWARTSFDMSAMKMMGGHAHHHHGHGDHGEDHGDEHGDHDEHEEEHHGLAILYPDNSTMMFETEHEDLPENASAWNLTETALTANNVTYTYQDSQYGAYITGINGFEAPEYGTVSDEDYWYWSVHIWNETSEGWETSPVGLSSIMLEESEDDSITSSEHVVIAASNANQSMLPTPEDDHDDHDHDSHDEAVCHDAVTHEDTDHTDRESCEAAGNIWMAGEPNDGTRGYLTIHVENEGDYGFAVPSDISVFILMSDNHEGHDHGGHDDHDEDGHNDHDEDGHDEGGHDENGHDEDGHDDADGDSNQDTTIEADNEEEAFDYDPHSWLDPISFKAQAQLVLASLIQVFPNGTDTFTANAEAFMAELDKVHLGYVGAFGPEGTCTNKTAAANHNAYSYITERYGVEFVTVHGLDPEGQPSVQDIEKVITKINEDEINVLFIEEYTQTSSVDIIVDETNVEVMYLYTMEKAPSDPNDNYISMLNKNLDNLKTGLGCAV